MKVTAAMFTACVTGAESLPADNLPVIAFVGRSNVGKSSLINTLVQRREMAKTSSTPGKTLTINFYLINEAFYIVDLPGYGYSKASKVTREKIQKMMDDFFEKCPNLKGILQIMDIRHPPSTLDKQMFFWLRERKINFLLVLNKSDKLGIQAVLRTQRQTMKDLRINRVIPFSSKTRQGREELLDTLGIMLEGGDFSEKAGRSQAPRKGGGGRDRKRSDGRSPQPGSGDRRPVPSAQQTGAPVPGAVAGAETGAKEETARPASSAQGAQAIPEGSPAPSPREQPSREQRPAREQAPQNRPEGAASHNDRGPSAPRNRDERFGDSSNQPGRPGQPNGPKRQGPGDRQNQGGPRPPRVDNRPQGPREGGQGGQGGQGGSQGDPSRPRSNHRRRRGRDGRPPQPQGNPPNQGNRGTQGKPASEIQNPVKPNVEKPAVEKQIVERPKNENQTPKGDI